MFSYQEFTTRNIGFVTPAEQEILKNLKVFIPGVGGMGGTALECLARCGIQNFIISDIDVFEVSNLNRQIFSNMQVVGQSKSESAKAQLLQINPHINVEVFDADWVQRLDGILDRVDIVINGCDDVKATVALMRKAKEKNKTVIDAFASTLPSVYVVKPNDPRPEEMFRSPTRKLSLEQITTEVQKAATVCETIYVMTHSSTVRHVVMQYAIEMVAGKRKRMSLAPMVWMTGLLMSYEVIKFALGKPDQVSCRGVFLNPWNLKYEKPLLWPFGMIKRLIVKSFLNRLLES